MGEVYGKSPMWVDQRQKQREKEREEPAMVRMNDGALSVCLSFLMGDRVKAQRKEAEKRKLF